MEECPECRRMTAETDHHTGELICYNRFCRKEHKMSLDEYQKKTSETDIYPDGYKIIYAALGLAGEAGEVANKVKKYLRDNQGEMTLELLTSIVEELGDTLWYIAALSSDLGIPLSRVAQLNLDKLSSRRKRGKLKGSGDNR